MSTSAVTSSLLSQIASSPSTADRFLTDLNQMAKDLEGGDLGAAQDDFVTLSEDALNGATSSTVTTSSSGITAALLSGIAASPSSSSSFVSELGQLGTDLQNGDLSSAQGDMLQMDSTALNAASSASSGSGKASSASGSTSPANEAEIATMVKTAVEAMDFGQLRRQQRLLAAGLDLAQRRRRHFTERGRQRLQFELQQLVYQFHQPVTRERATG